GISNGMNASYALGQADLTHAATALTQNGMNAPSAVAFDGVHNRLFVTEHTNKRVLVFDVRTNGSSSSSLCGTSTTGIANSMNASCVIGQSSFTANSAATTQAGLSQPEGV